MAKFRRSHEEAPVTISLGDALIGHLPDFSGQSQEAVLEHYPNTAEGVCASWLNRQLVARRDTSN